MATRNDPYSAFNFLVKLGDIPPAETEIFGGFRNVHEGHFFGSASFPFGSAFCRSRPSSSFS